MTRNRYTVWFSGVFDVFLFLVFYALFRTTVMRTTRGEKRFTLLRRPAIHLTHRIKGLTAVVSVLTSRPPCINFARKMHART
jgi:hypothetical protein